MPSGELLRNYPCAEDFFTAMGLALPPAGESVDAYFGRMTPDTLEELGVERRELGERFDAFMALLVSLREKHTGPTIDSITIQGGVDKSGAAEGFVLTVAPGEVLAIVGPTGSGKSRFLADIEWMAQGDTPTRRRVLINGAVPDPSRRFSLEHKLVAQLSQNMNFVMDLSVEEFIAMHAESRLVNDVAGITRTVIAKANELAGEQFSPRTPVTALSGGQSRALMIADTSCLSTSPIVLIDEIENAGIDRKRAVRTLVDERKIVLMATHDPILALMGDRRLVFKNGGVRAVIATTPAERANMAAFEEMDARLTAVRNALRNGELIEHV
ncbi:ATP-binding cassette domain-containing protein [Oryzomonas sagensis]|uniref:ATP-binding cassette domain-containing protein n=2 Tax=Oryzomonas sagensis TaxID=2603857 RepID=A0ABQ6TPX4_9BACT|nr:ATP-binding cassette domain-containing protein [Oryzomonas sagensis]